MEDCKTYSGEHACGTEFSIGIAAEAPSCTSSDKLVAVMQPTGALGVQQTLNAISMSLKYSMYICIPSGENKRKL